MTEQADPRQIVADGYDRIAERYADWATDDVVDEARPRLVALIVERLPQGAAVLDLGCGGGGPTMRQLAERFTLIGVDISARQTALARQNVPKATFIHGDMVGLEIPPGSFAAVVALYTLTHLPHGELPQLLVKISWWLRPGGLLVATMSARPDPGTIEPDWLGAPMYFSGYSVEENRRFVDQVGLKIESAPIESILEDGQSVQFLWIVASKP